MTVSEFTPEQIWDSLPDTARQRLWRLRELAGPGARVALVGGAVRDSLLGQANTSPDLDIAVQGGNIQMIAAALDVPFSWHQAYGNATLHLPDGLYADLVSARRESYPVAGGPPSPQPGTLEDDLARRDFTVNALALELAADGSQLLLSVPHGVEDLQDRTLRPLHARSFHDDASRLVRAARLAARLDLRAHPALLEQVPAALELAGQTPRLAAELRLLLDEPQPGRAARVLADWGAASLLPAGAADLLERLDALPGHKTRTLYAAALLSLCPGPAALEPLHLGQRPGELLARARRDTPAALASPEATLQELLGLTLPYPPLQGRDLLALGLKPGPALGQALHWLAEGRRAGKFGSTQDEREAVMARAGEGFGG